MLVNMLLKASYFIEVIPTSEIIGLYFKLILDVVEFMNINTIVHRTSNRFDNIWYYYYQCCLETEEQLN